MSRIFAVLLSFVCPISNVAAQNLISNGDFEVLRACPENVSGLASQGLHVSSPTTGTADVFSKCATGKVAIPDNFRGSQTAFSGDTYAGLYLFSPNNYREYLQLTLENPLKKGLYYDLHFQVSLAETSTVFTTSLNALLTNKPLQLETSKNLSKRRLTPLADYRLNFVKLQCMGSYKDMENWVTVKARFKAKGGETNLVVGNFEPDATTEKGNLEQGKPGVKAFSYYYVDGMTLVESNFQGYQKNKPYIIKGLHFATDSYDLSKHAKHNIRLLYTRIKTMPNVTLTVNGHTDDVGSEGHNKVLSYNRAKAVAHFLVKLGFPEERMIWKGHGNTKPLASELTKAGRLQNRRVDFVITQPARR